MSIINKDQIKHIAHLAKLNFTDSEIDKFNIEFNSILEYISIIKQCDTTNIKFEHNLSDYKDIVLQEDTIEPSIDRSKILQNATERQKNGYIKTSKIITKE